MKIIHINISVVKNKNADEFGQI